ncbi:metallophosphoesterase [Pokkaliibacter sp. CJK22405]|uniref:metallophosphoesterase n=1 Tax=Pokkaliibacter sp. CJK22405 TaxID=3384615 RepID=UPI003984F07F
MNRLFIMVLLLVGLHLYLVLRLSVALPGNGLWLTVLILWAVLSLVLQPLAIMPRRQMPKGLKDPLREKLVIAGYGLMGFFSSLLVVTLLRDIGMGIVSLFTAIPPVSWEASAWLVLAAAALMTLMGYANARRTARVKEVSVPIHNLPAAWRGFKIVQLTDIHVGPTIKRGYLEAIIHRANALDADMVAVTGDVVDGSVDALSHHTAPLASLRSRYGTYFVTGNHEYYSGAEAWTAEFARLGMKVLMNSHELLEKEGDILAVAGVTDYGAGHFTPHLASDPHLAAEGIPASAVKILLAHQPRSATAAEAAGFHLQLSGHTHGGQFWPWKYFVPMQQPFVAGLDRLAKLWIYTSRGTGYWGPPKRLGAPSEITLLTLVSD